MSDSSYCSTYNQLRNSRLQTYLPLRYTVTSPYPTYTKYQLDMRRKAEILKYNSSNQNSKTNSFTKSQKYSQIVNGTYQRISDYAASAISNCSDSMVYTSTTSSDVPGTPTYLYLDPSIPLYNYTTQRTFNSVYETDDRYWNTTYIADVECDNYVETQIGSVYIRDGIDVPYYTFTISTPVSIYISGRNAQLTVDNFLDFTRKPVLFSIATAECIVYYNDVSLNNSNVSNQVFPINNSTVVDVSLNTNSSGFDDFSANIYVGSVTFSNIKLYVTSGYVYDFSVKLNVSATYDNNGDFGESDYFENIEYYAVCNSSNTTLTSNNCVISTTESPVVNNTIFSVN